MISEGLTLYFSKSHLTYVDAPVTVGPNTEIGVQFAYYNSDSVVRKCALYIRILSPSGVQLTEHWFGPEDVAVGGGPIYHAENAIATDEYGSYTASAYLYYITSEWVLIDSVIGKTIATVIQEPVVDGQLVLSGFYYYHGEVAGGAWIMDSVPDGVTANVVGVRPEGMNIGTHPQDMYTKISILSPDGNILKNGVSTPVSVNVGSFLHTELSVEIDSPGNYTATVELFANDVSVDTWTGLIAGVSDVGGGGMGSSRITSFVVTPTQETYLTGDTVVFSGKLELNSYSPLGWVPESNETVTLLLNQVSLSTAVTDINGEFEFLIKLPSSARIDIYKVYYAGKLLFSACYSRTITIVTVEEQPPPPNGGEVPWDKIAMYGAIGAAILGITLIATGKKTKGGKRKK